MGIERKAEEMANNAIGYFDKYAATTGKDHSPREQYQSFFSAIQKDFQEKFPQAFKKSVSYLRKKIGAGLDFAMLEFETAVAQANFQDRLSKVKFRKRIAVGPGVVLLYSEPIPGSF